ncbi:hypothetical protein GCM10009117_12230 [Gangjinia marincola]|uniref:Pyridoxamine 5'-phosphate oxidase Alr4036 family FMN-binding domain-containing protein n=1 Tax=Gangjinia marincola TaxID=578463 RepID=A0ABN1MGP7_9FLAO
MLDELFETTWQELQDGCHKRKHPFKYCTFATLKNASEVKQRTVVFRTIMDNCLWFYTDYRSNKVYEIKEHNQVSVLFYHPKKLHQITVSGTIHLHTEGADVKKKWNGIQQTSKKDYTTANPPGTPISNPDQVEYGDEHYFTIMELHPTKIEYLRLKRPNHIRALFELKDGNWEKQFLVP